MKQLYTLLFLVLMVFVSDAQIRLSPDTVTYNTSGQLQGGGSYNVLSNDFRNICNSSTNVSTPGPLVSGISLTGSSSTPFAYFTIQNTGNIIFNPLVGPNPGTVPVGSYILNYTVCEGTGTTICQTQTVTITVTGSFKMVMPVYESVNKVNKTNLVTQNTFQIINFPDTNLKATLLEPARCYNLTNTDYLIVDSNNDGEIDTDEALQIGGVNLANGNISELAGLEYFTRLTFIGLAQNNVSSFNIPFPNLAIISIPNNPLISVNALNLPNLTGVNVSNTLVTSLNMSNNYLLTNVNIADNPITSLDLGIAPNLTYLFCKNNPNLMSINIKNTSLLDYSSTFMQQYCWTNCPSLTSICADSNEIPALQSFLSGCGVSTAGIDINSDCALGVDDFNDDAVALYPNPVKNSLQVSFAKTTNEKGTYAVYDVLGKKVLENAVAEGVDAITIPFENQANGVYLVKISVGDLVISKKVVKE